MEKSDGDARDDLGHVGWQVERESQYIILFKKKKNKKKIKKL